MARLKAALAQEAKELSRRRAAVDAEARAKERELQRLDNQLRAVALEAARARCYMAATDEALQQLQAARAALKEAEAAVEAADAAAALEAREVVWEPLVADPSRLLADVSYGQVFGLPGPKPVPRQLAALSRAVFAGALPVAPLQQ